MFPHADFVTDKVLHSGFFVLHRSGFAKLRSVALQLFCLTTTPGRAILMPVSYCCHKYFQMAASNVSEVRRRCDPDTERRVALP